jgi:hypothetical protein
MIIFIRCPHRDLKALGTAQHGQRGRYHMLQIVEPDRQRHPIHRCLQEAYQIHCFFDLTPHRPATLGGPGGAVRDFAHIARLEITF